ncbi:MAG: NAD(P)H-dependent glycerol-3-phosphate dehydrogenase [Thermomicrobiales bacterium]
MATCACTLSRNYYVGEQLAQGRTLPEIQASLMHAGECAFTTAAARKLVHLHGIEMPITEQLYSILYEDKPALVAIADLLQRETQHELRGTYGAE